MAPVLELSSDELRRYLSEERDTWRRWLLSVPQAIDTPVQPGGRFPTVGKLIDHIFLVERRYLQLLHGLPLSTETGLTGRNAAPLFDYGASVRRELDRYIDGLEGDEADQPRTLEVRERLWQITPRKLVFHILLHEIRHWAQVALAVRNAGLDPPGNHDLYSRSVK